MILKPKKTSVILKLIEQPSIVGSIHVPGAFKKKPNQGIVVAKGPLVDDWIDVGDLVLFNAYSGDKVVVDSGIFVVISDAHLVAVLGDKSVKLVDTETVKRVIRERLGEMASKYPYNTAPWYGDTIATDLCDRLDSLNISEGFEF